MEKKKWIVLGVAGFVAFAAFATAAAWFVIGISSPEPRMATGNLAGIVQPDEAAEPYEPTSAWMEEGLDLGVTRFEMASEQPASADAPQTGMDIDAMVANQVRANQNSLMPCYAQVLEQEDVQGTVDMQFGIAPDGHVAMVKVTRSTLRSKEAEDCFVDVAREWSFGETGRASLTKFDTDFGFYYE